MSTVPIGNALIFSAALAATLYLFTTGAPLAAILVVWAGAVMFAEKGEG